MKNSSEENDPHVWAGSYQTWELKRLLPVLEKTNIPFELEPDDSEIHNLILCEYTTYGQGAKAHVWVHRDDLEAFHRIHHDALGTSPGETERDHS